MAARLLARAQRVGGVEVGPGRSAIVELGGAAAGARGAVTAWVGVGRAPGPRVSIIAAVQGFELAATLAARALVREIDLATLQGSLVVVPVFRPGDRFARPGRMAAALALPGDAGGSRRARLAFALYSDVVVGAETVVVLGAPAPGRRALLTAEGAVDDGRVRKLAQAAGVQAVVGAEAAPASLLATASAAGRVAIRLSAGGAPAGIEADAAVLLAAVRRTLAALGAYAYPPAAAQPAPMPRAPVCAARKLVRAPAGGLLEEAVEVGAVVGQGDVLARVGQGPALRGEPRAVLAPAAGVVLEAPVAPACRKGAVLFLVGQTAAEELRRGARAAPPRLGPDPSSKLRSGWLEQVSLPDLGIGGIRAKIDTGAGTSALHVVSRRVVGTAAGPSRRPILELTLPTGGTSRRRLVVRAPVKEFLDVRDTSGRLERRPVIETTLQLGSLRRRIRLTLTDRGDMRCPMLVGRSALGPAVVVDPSARFLLGGGDRKRREES